MKKPGAIAVSRSVGDAVRKRAESRFQHVAIRVRNGRTVVAVNVPTAALGQTLAEAVQYATAVDTTATSKKKAG